MDEHNITGSIEGPGDTLIVTATQTRVVNGIVLPWVYVNGYTHVEEGRGEVFIEMNTLDELAEQGQWDSQFGSVLLLASHEGMALEQAGLAVEETRGGYHRTDELVALLTRQDRL